MTNCFHQRATCARGVLLLVEVECCGPGVEFGIRILNGLIMLMLEVITNFVMCSGRNFNTGEGSSI